MRSRRFLYVADPMCSWCWGFAPVIEQIDSTYREKAPIRLIAGGLRVGTETPMDDRAKAVIRGHWEQVRETTGQPFNFDFFDRQDYVYDTEPACRAVVAVRNLAPASTLRYFAALQHAFYVENLDVTCSDVLADVAVACELNRDAFAMVYAANEIGESLAADFAGVQAMQIGGFPALLVQDDDGVAFLTVGYRSFAALQPLIDRWLQDRDG